LKNHIFPYIGDKHVSEIKVKELVSIYEKIAEQIPGFDLSQTLMIGDSLTADIAGGGGGATFE